MDGFSSITADDWQLLVVLSICFWCVAQASSYCKTWVGKGDCTQGELQAAADVDFYIDIDTTKGEEMVIVSDIKQPRRQQSKPTNPCLKGFCVHAVKFELCFQGVGACKDLLL